MMQRKTLSAALLATTFVLHGSSFAGKPERDKMTEMKPHMTEMAKNVKAACKCDVKVTVDEKSYTKADDMFRIKEAVEAFETAAKNQCSSPENTKAFCSNVNSLTIKFGKDVGDPEHKGKTITLFSNDSSYNSDEQIKRILDKF